MFYDKKVLLSNEKFLEAARKMYACSPEQSAARLADLAARHAERFGIEGARVFSSPGRIEVCGNHTDHNNGKVTAAAVSVDTLAVVTPLTERKVKICSLGYPYVEVDVDDLKIDPNEEGTSAALIRGVLKGMQERGYAVGGFAATMTSNVCKGAGMSSSASYEVLIAEIVNVLYNGGKAGAVEKAQIAQFAENVYFGKPSGLMDQSAIALGGISYIDFRDTKNPEVRKLDWNFDDVSVVVINCGGDHCDLTPQYAAIRTEMEMIAAHFGKEKLRFVEKADFYAAIPALIGKYKGRAILRAMHFFEENDRVDALVDAIDRGDEATALSLITASGKSSLEKLQNLYAEGDSSEPIPLALAIASEFDGVKAYRVHGGGFAGTILTFVAREKEKAFCDYMAKLYGAESVFPVRIREAGGTEILL